MSPYYAHLTCAKWMISSLSHFTPPQTTGGLLFLATSYYARLSKGNYSIVPRQDLGSWQTFNLRFSKGARMMVLHIHTGSWWPLTHPQPWTLTAFDKLLLCFFLGYCFCFCMYHIMTGRRILSSFPYIWKYPIATFSSKWSFIVLVLVLIYLSKIVVG